MLSPTSTHLAMARLADSLDTPTNGAGPFDAASPPRSGDIPRVEVADLVGQLQHNRVPLMAVVSTAPDWLAGHPLFQKELAAEREWHATQRGEYVLVRDAWLREGIPCLMIKSAGNHPAFPHTSDNIDVLVRPAQGRAARDVLRQLGYVELRNVEEPGKFLFRKFHDGKCVSAIHVHELVAWFVGFMDEASLWARMRPATDDPLVNVPSPEDAILINLAHACYENKRLRLNDVLRVRFALQAGSIDWSYMEHVADSRGWLEGLCLLVLAFDAVERRLYGAGSVPAAQLAHLMRTLRRWPYAVRHLEKLTAKAALSLPVDLGYWDCKRVYYAKIVRDPVRTVRERWRDVGVTLAWGIKLKSRIRPQPGLVVALSGVDGSGKTAHARALVDALRLCEVRTNYVWARGGSTGLPGVVSRLRRALGAAAPAMAAGGGDDGQAGDALERRRARLTRPLPRLAWSWLVAADQVATYWLRAALPARLGKVVVTDRHVLDAAVEMDAALPADAAWSRSAITTMLRLAPQPDLGFVLDVSAATARARKAHEPWQPDVTEEARRYRDTARRHGLRVLSTDGPFAQSNDIVVRDSAMLLMSRFETWGNALFLSNPSQKNTPDPVWQQPFRLPAGTQSEQPARAGTAAVLIAATVGLMSLALISGRTAR